jgi:predicted HTH domain antitoxin
MKTGESKV